MMAVHELGHVMHAYASGGRVSRVLLPWFGFSQTFFRSNPHPHFVVWGGPIWGCVLPALIWAVMPLRWTAIRQWAQFWAGFCLIANGAYLGVGWAKRVGDAGDLIGYGTPVWLMILFGAVALSAGFWLWHLLGKREDDRRKEQKGSGFRSQTARCRRENA